MIHHLLHHFSAVQLNIFTEFYVLVDTVIDITSKMKKSDETSRGRDQGRTYKSGSEKKKLK